MNVRAARAFASLGIVGTMALLLLAGPARLHANAESFTPRLEIQATTTPQGTVLDGVTNLPDRVELHYTLSPVGQPPIGGGVLSIKDGKVVSSAITVDGKPLPPGEYEFGAGCTDSDTQPEALRRLFEKNGKNLDGPLVQPHGETVRIVYKTILTIR